MNNKTILGGIAGGIVLFVWGAAAHMILPLGETGLQALPDENKLMTAMRNTITEPGLYLFPMEGSQHDPAAQSTPDYEAWTAKYETGPVGFLVYRPTGSAPMSPRKLATQFGSDVAAALLAALLLGFAAHTLTSFSHRVIFVAALGLFSWLVISVPYWNWYGFPTDFTMAGLIERVVGWTLGGVVIAAIVKQSSAAELTSKSSSQFDA